MAWRVGARHGADFAPKQKVGSGTLGLGRHPRATADPSNASVIVFNASCTADLPAFLPEAPILEIRFISSPAIYRYRPTPIAFVHRQVRAAHVNRVIDCYSCTPYLAARPNFPTTMLPYLH